MAIESFMNPEAKERFLKAQLVLEQASSSSVSFDILPPGFSSCSAVFSFPR
jgi:hypothetical protein